MKSIAIKRGQNIFVQCHRRNRDGVFFTRNWRHDYKKVEIPQNMEDLKNTWR